jgi:hypothetical protein
MLMFCIHERTQTNRACLGVRNRITMAPALPGFAYVSLTLRAQGKNRPILICTFIDTFSLSISLVGFPIQGYD